jgi:Ca2+-binding RTX toxin-like protein
MLSAVVTGGALAALALTPQLGLSAANASTVSFSSRCCFDLRIVGDDSANRLRLSADGARIVLHDATPGATIRFEGPASRCTGEGTPTLSCARGSLVSPVSVLVAVGPGDSFDTGAPGCAGGEAFALAGGSRAGPGAGKANIWGGPFPDQFASYGRASVHGCGGADQLNATRGAANGGPGADFISERGDARLSGGRGDDQVIAANGGTAGGGDGDDELYDVEGRSTLHGGPGADQVGDRFCTHEDRTGDGHDRMFGGRGQDYLAAGCVSRPVAGDPGAQRLVPTEPDLLDGGPGDDRGQAGRRSVTRRLEHIAWLPRTVR